MTVTFLTPLFKYSICLLSQQKLSFCLCVCLLTPTIFPCLCTVLCLRSTIACFMFTGSWQEKNAFDTVGPWQMWQWSHLKPLIHNSEKPSKVTEQETPFENQSIIHIMSNISLQCAAGHIKLLVYSRQQCCFLLRMKYPFSNPLPDGCLEVHSVLMFQTFPMH